MRAHLTAGIMILSLASGAATLASGAATAGEADVVAVEVSKEEDGTYRFDVAVEHGDEGWDHYADAWDVVATDGTVFGTRVLAHPHENEQPFTRSLGGVSIPDGVAEVVLRAKDNVHDYGGVEMTVTLPAE